MRSIDMDNLALFITVGDWWDRSDEEGCTARRSVRQSPGGSEEMKQDADCAQPAAPGSAQRPAGYERPSARRKTEPPAAKS